MTRRSLALAFLCLSLDAAAQSQVVTTTADFDTGTLSNVSSSLFANEVVLGRTPVSSTHLVWTTNYLYGYVVRIDSLTGKQTGRYDSALANVNGVATGAQAAQTYCDFATTGNCPGRMAVDSNGDVWIVNRAFNQQGTLTKLSGNLAHCIDRNNNGVIDTSFDKNGDGLIDVAPAAGEYFGQNDECILTTFKVGPINALPRGVAIDKYGKVWVSTFNDGKVYRYNPLEPVALEATVTVGGSPYSLATGGDYLFVSNNGAGGTKRVHITALAVGSVACPTTYGIVADPAGNQAWLGSYPGTGVYRADFINNACPLLSSGQVTTAITLDLAGNVWAANYNGATVSKFNAAGVLLGTYAAGGTNPHGLSVDFQGNLWVVLHGPPSLAKINTNTGALIGTYTIGGPGIPNGDPYNYSDFTGTQIDRQAPYARVGTWSRVFDGGRAQLPWSKVSWNSEAQGAVPALTSLVMSVRSADSLAALATGSFAVVANGAALSNVPGRYLEVKANVTGPGFVTPVLSDVSVQGPCPVQGEACCVFDTDCGDVNSCTADSCPVPGGACLHAPIALCCQSTADCNDGDVCTDDVCPAPGGTCVSTARAGCCSTNVQCDDGDPCTVDACSGPGGTCSHQAIAACCHTAADCTGGSLCAVASCPVAGGVCLITPVSGCCTSDAQCADTDACTAEHCDVASGTCSSTVVAGCCQRDADCNDGLPCTQDRCSGVGGVCVTSPIAACCMVNADCNDGNECTTDSCPGAGDVCVHTAQTGCCRTGLDCNDGNQCTTDDCVQGSCTTRPIAGCCANAADCSEGSTCVSGTCVAADAGSTLDAGESADAGPGPVAVKPGCGCDGVDGFVPFASLLALLVLGRRR